MSSLWKFPTDANTDHHDWESYTLYEYCSIFFHLSWNWAWYYEYHLGLQRRVAFVCYYHISNVKQNSKLPVSVSCMLTDYTHTLAKKIILQTWLIKCKSLPSQITSLELLDGIIGTEISCTWAGLDWGWNWRPQQKQPLCNPTRIVP